MKCVVEFDTEKVVGATTIIVDGKDITDKLAAFHVTLAVGSLPVCKVVYGGGQQVASQSAEQEISNLGSEYVEYSAPSSKQPWP